MKVYVIMGNDFPDSVKATQAIAEEYIAAKIAEGKLNRPHGSGWTPRINWRYYEFNVDSPPSQTDDWSSTGQPVPYKPADGQW